MLERDVVYEKAWWVECEEKALSEEIETAAGLMKVSNRRKDSQRRGKGTSVMKAHEREDEKGISRILSFSPRRSS